MADGIARGDRVLHISSGTKGIVLRTYEERGAFKTDVTYAEIRVDGRTGHKINHPVITLRKI